jgi:hypothetical protein
MGVRLQLEGFQLSATDGSPNIEPLVGSQNLKPSSLYRCCKLFTTTITLFVFQPLQTLVRLPAEAAPSGGSIYSTCSTQFMPNYLNTVA